MALHYVLPKNGAMYVFVLCQNEYVMSIIIHWTFFSNITENILNIGIFCGEHGTQKSKMLIDHANHLTRPIYF